MATGFQQALIAWSEGARRDLPWRRTRDPWAIVVSELMLQQTQVARVVPRYTAFLERFPSPAACAAAPLADVLRSWAGLGYNRRALSLHRLAVTVVADHGGRLPAEMDALLALPGVGPYTARAVLAFAFEQDVGVVDTNAARVLARTAGHRLTAPQVQERADSVVPHGSGWSWNQGMLDLGATICTKRSPRCGACPAAPFGRWRASGGSFPDPAAGSAGTSGAQSTFAGSDRQGRGRMIAALRQRPVAWAEVAAAAGWPADPDRARRVAATLVADGLAVEVDDGLRLP
jgi:A/G-specific adenine glycosylase